MAKKTTIQQMTTPIIKDSVLNFLSYMPNPDDVAHGTSASYETYRNMRKDPRIKSLLSKIKSAALNFPMFINQDDSDDKVYKFIKDLKIFKNMQKRNKRLLTALDYGFCVAELIWKIENNKYIPNNFIPRKPERFSFNSNWELFLNVFGQKIKLYQSYKWLIFQHDPDDENPYGTSVLRCCYWAYMFKQAGYDFWLQATEKFSVTSLVGLFTADGGDENKLRQTAQEIAEMLMNVSSGSTGALANVSDVKEIKMGGDLSHFKELVEACDLQISYGLTGQSIATSSTNGGSLALGEVQADMMFEDCKSIALELQKVLQKIIDWTVELNFGPGTAAPQLQFDVDKKASFDQVMQAIDRKIPVSKSALYSQYALPKPQDEDDAFVREDSAMMLSDSDKKKKKLSILLSDSSYLSKEKEHIAELENLCDVAQNAIKPHLKKILNDYLNSVKNGSKAELNKPYYVKDDADFVHSVEKLVLSSYLLGMIHADEERPGKEINAADDEIPPIKFEEAVKFLEQKMPITKDEWKLLEPKARFRAFTVAKLGSATLIDTVKQQLLGVLEDGKGYAEFWNRIKQTVENDVSKIKPGYWETVFRTNTQSAYVAGKLQQFENSGVAAYQLMVIEDVRTSRICRNLLNKSSGYGIILPVKHPFWQKYGFPPYHFNCRSSIRGVWPSQVGKIGNVVTNPGMKSFQLRDFKPQGDFGGNPLVKGSWWELTAGQMEQAKELGIVDVLLKLFSLIKD